MRLVAAFLVVVQLIARGASVPHCHSHSGKPEPADHSSRPHVHVAGHSHSHASDHKNSKHKHSHPHSHQHPKRGTPVKSSPIDSLPLSSDHDEDSIYVSNDALIVSSDRIQVSEQNDGQWFFADFNARQAGIALRRIECRAVGPPRDSAATLFAFLPHVLRV